MKKSVLLLFILTTSLWAYAQKSASKKSPVKNHPSEETVLKERAKDYFKNVYVKVYFKDPYSYKLMNIELAPVTIEEKCNKLIRDADYQITDLDTTREYGSYQMKLKSIKRDREYQEKWGKTDSLGKANAKIMSDRLKEDLAKIASDYHNAVVIKGKTQFQLSSLSPEIRKRTAEYRCYLDCYGRNSYGNLVLNKYVFTISKEGEVSDVSSLDNN